ncbi:unnamed protein product, partial [Heterosigma akashiwo]
ASAGGCRSASCLTVARGGQTTAPDGAPPTAPSPRPGKERQPPGAKPAGRELDWSGAGEGSFTFTWVDCSWYYAGCDDLQQYAVFCCTGVSECFLSLLLLLCLLL